MKLFASANLQSDATVPEVTATPIDSRRGTDARAIASPERTYVSGNDAATISFLKQFRVLIGAARLYQRNHPRLMDILASAEQQLRAALASRSALAVAIERNGIIVPRQNAGPSELLSDPRGELRGLAEELLRAGICSILFAPQINVGELDQLAHQISQVPRSATPGDTSSRKIWEEWLHEQRIAGIRLNIPTERRDSLLLASLVSAVLAYDQAPQRSARARASAAQPAATFEQAAATLRLLAKLAPPHDPETQTAAEDVARRMHSSLSAADATVVSLVVHGVSRVKPREGETLEPYLGRLADSMILAFMKQEFDAERVAPPELMPLLVRLDQERTNATREGSTRSGSAHDEMRVAAFCEKFWGSLASQELLKTLRSSNAWCVPSAVISRLLEPPATSVEAKKSDAETSEARGVLCAYARCLESEQGKARRTVAAGLSELAPQIERLWPHPSAPEFARGIVQALLLETSPGIAGLLSAVVENLAHGALAKREYAEFERILETLESAPRDEDHAHISTLIDRLLNNEQWLYLVDDAMANQGLNPVIPRLLKRCPDRLIDRMGLLLTSTDGLNLLPAMVRLVHATGEPVVGALEARLYEPRRQRIATAIYLLASADPKRLAGALPRALPSWEWSLQDLTVSELVRWTNPAVVEASARAFLAVVPEAHGLVVPCMIDHLGFANLTSAVPLLLQIAKGESLVLRDIYFRIKAIEALGRMRVDETAPLLRQMLRERSGLAHSEPAALRMAAEEALGLIENHPSSARVRTAEKARSKSNTSHARPRRYLRVQVPSPLPASITGAHAGAARVRTLSLGGAMLETQRPLTVGESLRIEIRSGLRRIHSTAVVRNVSHDGAGVEFVHMKPEDRERLRRLVAQLLQ